MDTLGTPANPLRVAIIGSGPSGFYAADHLEKVKDLTIEIDMFERLPTPYGLVRGGVAPDHQKIKSVTKVYDRIATWDGFRFYGSVEFGRDLTHADMEQLYHAVIFAVGAQTDKHLGIPGEELAGSHAATEFVAWYNGHPDFRDKQFDLSAQAAAVIGVGNVAMDVTRVLARSIDELSQTDIADYALAALAASGIKRVYVLGRRGPAQAAFTNPEIKELGELPIADLVIDPAELQLDPLTEAYLKNGATSETIKNMETMRALSQRRLEGKPRQVILRFLVSPVELIGTDRVEAIKVVHNELVDDGKGGLSARPTDRTEVIPVGLVFRSVGYRGVALPDVPFYDKWGTIPNDHGRVLREPGGEQVLGDYVVGWIKRGPSGIIGTNKPDSVETVEALLADARAGRVIQPTQPTRAALEALLAGRGINYITFADWQRLDALEQERGQAVGRPRVKFTSVEEMLAEIARLREQAGS